MRDLERKSHTFIKVDKFFPSSQLCFKCGYKQKLEEKVRTYVCPICGYTEDRDVNSALNIQREGMRMLETGKASKDDKCKVPKGIDIQKILMEYKKSIKKPVEREPILSSQFDSLASSLVEPGSPAFRRG